ncbi:hypothetical protein [Mucilaginibacter sp.]|uniref:hypothetical protein n=1 Tax=Mucilaginibacter sp. TaxID=1882438 RepID=UPI002ED3A9D0
MKSTKSKGFKKNAGGVIKVIATYLIGLRKMFHQKFSDNKKAISVFYLIASFSSTDNGRLIEHIYGFLITAERILQKYGDENSKKISG